MLLDEGEPQARNLMVLLCAPQTVCIYAIPGSTELLLADEPHALVTSTRLGVIDGFLKARRYGYGATLKGRFDGRDKLITGIFGPVLAERTYLEAVEEGAICPLNIIMFQIEADSPFSV